MGSSHADRLIRLACSILDFLTQHILALHFRIITEITSYNRTPYAFMSTYVTPEWEYQKNAFLYFIRPTSNTYRIV